MNLAGLEAEVKQAQKRVGELMWLMSRTRPDIQYVTSLMASRITREPELVNRVGQRLFDYLNETIGYRIRLENQGEEEVKLSVYTDSSFAPSAGRSHGCTAVFLGQGPITWRSSRQPLPLEACFKRADRRVLALPFPPLIEGIEGTLLGLSVREVIQEILRKPMMINLFIDNQAAVTLVTASSGSWRTRHLKLRSHWMKERIQSNEVRVQHVSGAYQRADLGTKPFTRTRLKELVDLWNIVDRRESTTSASVKTIKVDQGWLMKLLMLCQICGTKAMKEDLAAEIPWDLYAAIIVLAAAVIGAWEALRKCTRMSSAKVRSLRTKALKAQKLSKTELKELQRLLTYSPSQLSCEQMRRMCELKEKFENTMPSTCTPLPTSLPDEPTGPFQSSSVSTRLSDGPYASSTSLRSLPLLQDPKAASSSTPSAFNKQPKATEKTTCDKGTQADWEPAFSRVQPPPPIEIRMYEGPFTMTQGSEKLHLFDSCWGLRNASRTSRVQLCRCCAENGGRRIY